MDYASLVRDLPMHLLQVLQGEERKMRRLTVLLVVSLLLPAILVVAPAAGAKVAPAAPATAHASAHGSSYDPIIGNWYRGERWFRVRGPFNGVYRAAWSNGSGPLIRYKIARKSTNVYYETANPLNTYRILSSYKIRVHYETTDGSYITRSFLRVE
jgi:hypothetical protein